MKKLLPLMIILLFISNMSCKKAIENKEKQLLLAAITDGTWFVQQYVEGATDITGTFTNYNFKFYDNDKVIGVIFTDTTSGTWSGDIANSSITSQFPTASDPVKKLNGIWKLTTTYTNYVEAEMNTSNGKNILHLQKN